MSNMRVVEYGNKLAMYNGKICLSPINNNNTPIKYGRLYNGYAISDLRKIGIGNWRVPISEVSSFEQFDTLVRYGVNYMAWYNDYLAVISSLPNTIRLYKIIGGILTYLAATAMASSNVVGLDWSSNGVLAMASGSAPYITSYKLSGDTLISQPIPNPTIPNLPMALAWHSGGTYLSVLYGNAVRYTALYTLVSSGLTLSSVGNGGIVNGITNASMKWNGDYLLSQGTTTASITGIVAQIFKIVGGVLGLKTSLSNNTTHRFVYWVDKYNVGIVNSTGVLSIGNFNGEIIESELATNLIIPIATFNILHAASVFGVGVNSPFGEYSNSVLYTEGAQTGAMVTYYGNSTLKYSKRSDIVNPPLSFNYFSVSKNNRIALSTYEATTRLMWFQDNLSGDTNDLVRQCDSRGGRQLRVSGTVYWTTNAGLNVLNFNGKGGGKRFGGSFLDQKTYQYIWGLSSSGQYVGLRLQNVVSTNTTDDINFIVDEINSGLSVRLCRDATANEQNYVDGTSCEPYYDYEGNKYPTVKIGKLVWLGENLITRFFSNGDEIFSTAMNDVDWDNLTTPACCIYNNSDVNL